MPCPRSYKCVFWVLSKCIIGGMLQIQHDASVLARQSRSEAIVLRSRLWSWPHLGSLRLWGRNCNDVDSTRITKTETAIFLYAYNQICDAGIRVFPFYMCRSITRNITDASVVATCIHQEVYRLSVTGTQVPVNWIQIWYSILKINVCNFLIVSVNVMKMISV